MSGIDFNEASKERTLLLMRLNIAAYPPCQEKLDNSQLCSYSASVMQDLFNKKLSMFGPNINTMSLENGASIQFDEENWKFLEDNNFEQNRWEIPNDSARFDFGVSAVEWRIGTTTILAFRGTYSDGDYANIEHWMTDYLLEKSTERMHRAWTEDAGLEWTNEMQERFDSHDDRLDKLAIRTFQKFKADTFPKDLAKAVAQNATLYAALNGFSEQEAKDTGYWKLTKYITDIVASRAQSEKRTLILTGHSQGGTRAQLASMHLKQAFGLTIPTVTFAATGSACMARKLFNTDANLLQDVDPFVAHENMVDYVHPLDPYGNSMLGEDTGGKVCYFGTTKLYENRDEPDGAYKYCSHVYGWRGPTVVAKEHEPPLNVKHIELRSNFKRCRYFTHNAKSMFFALSKSLENNGDTDGGCFEVQPIPRNDPQAFCPTGELTKEEVDSVVAVVILLTVLLLLVVYILYKLFDRQKKQIKKRGRDFGMEEHTSAITSPSSSAQPKQRTFDSEEEDAEDTLIELPQIT